MVEYFEIVSLARIFRVEQIQEFDHKTPTKVLFCCLGIDFFGKYKSQKDLVH